MGTWNPVPGDLPVGRPVIPVVFSPGINPLRLKGTNMIRVLHLGRATLVAAGVWFSFCCMLFAQTYREGDVLVVVQSTQIRTEGRDVDNAPRGFKYVVQEVQQQGRLKVCRVFPGWISDKHVVALDRALEHFRKARDARDYWGRGNVHEELGAYENARDDFLLAIKKDPSFFPAYHAMGTLQYRESKYTEATEWYDKALNLSQGQLARERAIVFTSRGRCRLLLGNTKGALSDADSAISLEPRFAAAHVLRGNILAQLSRSEEALSEYEKALRLDSKEAWAYRGRAKVYLTIGESDKAIRDFGNAIDICKGYCENSLYRPTLVQHKMALADTLCERGGARQETGDEPQARKDLLEGAQQYADILGLKPNSLNRARALYGLGATQAELGDSQPAGATYDMFLKEFPDHELATEVRMRKGETLLQTGQLAEAEKLFAEVCRVEGSGFVDHATFRLAECAFKQDKFAVAGDLFATVATKFQQSTYADDAIIRAGQAFYRAKEFEKAAVWFDKVIAAGGKNAVEAAHWRCRIYLQHGQTEKAAELAAATLPKAADSPFLVHLMMDEADGLFEQPARRAESLPLYAKIYRDHPDHEQAPHALYYAAHTALDLKQYDEALAHANALLEKFPDHELRVDVQYVAAESLLQSGKYAASEKLYRELLAAAKDGPKLHAWHLRVATVFYLQKKREDVVTFLTPLMESFKQDEHRAEAQFLLGTCQFHLGRYDAAAEALQASLAADPQWTQADEAWLNLSRSQQKLNQLDAAIESVKRVLEDFPQSRLLDRANYRLAEYSYASGDFPAAISGYDTVIVKWPDSPLVPHALSGKAWSQLSAAAHAEADRSFTMLMEGYPDSPLSAAALSARASCRYHTKNFDGAIADVSKYLQSSPGPDERADALFVRGLSQAAAKKYADATQTYERILSEKPDYQNAAKVLYELGWAWKSQDKEDEAVKAFSRLASEYPDDALAAEAFFRVGESQFEQEQFAAAVKAYTSSAEKAGNPDVGEKAHHKLGWANFRLGQFDKALAAFSNQLATYPTGTLYSEGLFMKGECLFKLGRYEETHRTLTNCLELGGYADERTILILLHAGQSASQTKNWRRAIHLLEKIPATYPESSSVPEAVCEQGWAQQNLGNNAEAVKLYKTAAEKSRTAVGVRACFMLGELHFGNKDYDQATREFSRVVSWRVGEQTPNDIRWWQAKSAYEAARCYHAQIKGAEKPEEREAYTKEAIRYYTIVSDKFSDSPEAPLAAQGLQSVRKFASE